MMNPTPSNWPRVTRRVFVVIALAIAATGLVARAQQVEVRQAEGLVHGFLTLRNLEGVILADGDLIQTSRGSRVTSRLLFHFKDGSVHDETTVFSQDKGFRVISDRLIQKGPTFPQPLDMAVDVPKGRVTVRYADDHGKERVEDEHMKLPTNLANGLLPILLKDVRPNAPVPELTLVAATPKPRLVKLVITSNGDDAFNTGAIARKATHYVVKVEIGGIAGLVAPLLGKQPPESHVWIMGGEAPAFIKSQQPLYLGGPLWQIELAAPAWPRSADENR